MTDEEKELYETEPEVALNRYLSDRETDVKEATYQAHRYRLPHFVRYCGEEGIEDLSELTGRD